MRLDSRRLAEVNDSRAEANRFSRSACAIVAHSARWDEQRDGARRLSRFRYR